MINFYMKKGVILLVLIILFSLLIVGMVSGDAQGENFGSRQGRAYCSNNLYCTTSYGFVNISCKSGYCEPNSGYCLIDQDCTNAKCESDHLCHYLSDYGPCNKNSDCLNSLVCQNLLNLCSEPCQGTLDSSNNDCRPILTRLYTNPRATSLSGGVGGSDYGCNHGSCFIIKNEGEQCTNNWQCQNGLSCNADSCSCKSFETYNPFLKKCLASLLIVVTDRGNDQSITLSNLSNYILKITSVDGPGSVNSNFSYKLLKFNESSVPLPPHNFGAIVNVTPPLNSDYRHLRFELFPNVGINVISPNEQYINSADTVLNGRRGT